MSRKAALRTISGQNIINELKSKDIIVKCQNVWEIDKKTPFTHKDAEEAVHNAGLSKKVARLNPLTVIKGE